jgi:hypothetical protein
MDLKAKVSLRSLILTSSAPLSAAPLCSEGWRCILNDVKITSDPSKQIYKAGMGKQLQSHLHECNILPSVAFLDVDWDAINSATSHFPPLYKLWMSKHVSGFFGMGKADDETLAILESPKMPLLPTYQGRQSTPTHLP